MRHFKRILLGLGRKRKREIPDDSDNEVLSDDSADNEGVPDDSADNEGFADDSLDNEEYYSNGDIPDEDIIHPERSITKYSTFELDNGLSVLLVYSPQCQQAAAAVAIKCGSFADPPSSPGLAHLLEHVLFLGSKDYPGVNQFKTFVERNGGDVYARTGLDSSVFSIEVPQHKLDDSLKMFADFLSNPVMDMELIRKELTIIDLEFRLHMYRDSVRSNQLLSHTSSEGHPFHRFTCGNENSLSLSPDVSKLFKDYYIASNMKLVIMSPYDDFDFLKHLARTHFTKLRTNPTQGIGGSQKFDSSNKIWETGVAYVLESLENTQSIRISWLLPPNQYGASRPEKLISYILGQENKGSVSCLWKSKGWVTKFNVQVGNNPSFGSDDDNWDYISTSAGQMFTIEAHLTNLGWKKRYELLAYVFQYFNLLRDQRPPQSLIDEYATSSSIKYWGLEHDLSNTSAFAIRLADNMLKKPSVHALSLDFLYDFGKEAEMLETLEHLTPENMRIDFLSKPFKDGEEYEVEPIYKAKYRREMIPKEFINTWLKGDVTDSPLFLPPLNKFMPSSSSFLDELERLNLRFDSSDDEVDPIFVTCLDEYSTKLLHRQDKSALLSYAHFNVYTTVVPDKEQEANIFIEMVKEDLSAILVSGEDAYINTSISFDDMNILKLRFEGFHEKFKSFISEIWKRLKSFTPTKEVFQNIKYKMQREFTSVDLARQAFQLLSNALQGGKDKFEGLSNTAFEDLRDLNFLSKIRVVGVCGGSLSKEESEQIVGIFEATGDFPITKAEKLKLTPGHPYRITAKPKNELETNSLAQVFFQISCEEKCREIAFLAILQSLIKTHLYCELRQEEQLGYDVGSGLCLNGTRGFFLYVVSANHKPPALLKRIYNFIGAVSGILDGVDERSFETYKIVAAPNHLPSGTGICDELIHDLGLIKGRTEMALSMMREMQKDEVISLFKKYFTRETCSSLEICISSDEDEDEDEE